MKARMRGLKRKCDRMNLERRNNEGQMIKGINEQ
jgi:hypothetical protein